MGHIFIYLLLSFVHSSLSENNENILKELKERDENALYLLLQEIMVKTLQPYNCIVIMTDSLYTDMFDKEWFRRFGLFIQFITIYVEEYEDLYAPYETTKASLLMAKNQGCQLYIILLANGIQVSRLLQFGDRYRSLNTLSKYILLYDNRLFEKSLFYLWRRIINVVFIKKYISKNSLTGNLIYWYEISTVPFPVPITNVLIPRRLDIWANASFRKGSNLFRDKTSDLQNQTLKVVAIGHVPGVTKSNSSMSAGRASLVNTDSENETTHFSGTEIEILETVSKAMNFRFEIYEPENADTELWGRKLIGGYTGIIGEIVDSHADFAVGDLYYTPHLLNLMDLSIPYNTECLTFLTPEALSDISWKTLILPFKPIMWGSVFIALIISILAFHYLARFQIHITELKGNYKDRKLRSIFNTNGEALHEKKKKVITLNLVPSAQTMDSNTKYAIMKEKYQIPKHEDDPVGLYQFSEPINSALYTYSMLLLVSLPTLPTGWSLRMMTGWYWLYCLLVVTAYRASMTAILSRPTPKVAIDTLQDLVSSQLIFGGWGEINTEFFKLSSDQTISMIAEKFVIVNSSEDAVDKVAGASFAFYENTYFLKEALVKRQQRYKTFGIQNSSTDNYSENETRDVLEDRGLHIMSDCIINMPISIGLQKNSPVKPRVDKYVRRVLEAGLIKKWLDDVMQKVYNTEISTDDSESLKALMNMKKFSGALVALLIGYVLSVLILVSEFVYFHFFVKKNPNFNKYSKSIQKVDKPNSNSPSIVNRFINL